MNIDTKFKPGDIAYYIKDNRVATGEVESITIFVHKDNPPDITCKVIGNYGYPRLIKQHLQDNAENISERHLYRSKEELIKSL